MTLMATCTEVVVKEEDLCCYICLELYDNPRTLPCLHSFCHLCLVGYAKKGVDKTGILKIISCPICRADIIPDKKVADNAEKWVESLPVNFTLVSILSRKTERKMSNVKNKCDQCLRDALEASATVYCYECSEKLCEKCKEIHKKVKFLSSHRLCDIKNRLNDVAKLELLKSLTRCPEHPSEEVRYICKDHDQLCCNECAIVSHRKCNQMVSIANEQVKVASSVESRNDRFKELTEYLEKLIRYEDEHQSRIASCKNELEDKLKHIKRRIDDAFRDMEQTIRDEFDKKSSLILKESMLQKEEIESLKSEVRHSVTKLETAKEFGQPLHLFLIQRILKDETEKHEGEIRRLCDKLSKQIVQVKEQINCNDLEQNIKLCLHIYTKCSDATVPFCPGILKYKSWLEAVKSKDKVPPIDHSGDIGPKVQNKTPEKELDSEQEYKESAEEDICEEDELEDEVASDRENNDSDGRNTDFFLPVKTHSLTRRQKRELQKRKTNRKPIKKVLI